MRVEMLTFLLAGAICLGGSLGVVLLRNPVHNALSLVATLFGVAVLFLNQEAWFLAAIQVIVYAGAIVVLFLFVIMLLGVDRVDRSIDEDVMSTRRLFGLAAGVGLLSVLLVVLLTGGKSRITGATTASGASLSDGPDIDRLGELLFTKYVFAFEITAALLTIAVVGAVILVRRAQGRPVDDREFPEPSAALTGESEEGAR